MVRIARLAITVFSGWKEQMGSGLALMHSNVEIPGTKYLIVEI